MSHTFPTSNKGYSYLKRLLPTLLIAANGLHAEVNPDINLDLSAHWKLDGDALDSSTNGHNATGDDSPQWSSGLIDQALTLADVTDTLTYSDNVPIGESFSISAWINPSVATQDAGIWMKGTDGQVTSHAKELSIFQGVPVFKYTHTDGQTFFELSSNQATTPGQWTHIAVVRDDSTGNAQIFVNGVLANEAAQTPTPVDGVAPSHFGHWGIGTGHFNGQIDDIRVYDRAITQEEVTGLYTSLISLEDLVATGLSAYWEFEGDGLDSSGNGHNADVNGGATFETGIQGQAVILDGIDDHLRTQTNVIMGTEFTISAWIQPGAHSSLQQIFSKGAEGETTASNSKQLRLESGEFTMVYEHGSGTDYKISSSWISPLNEWSHIVGVRDSDGATYLYVDGTLNAQDSGSTAPSINSPVSNIGRREGGTEYYQGMIDELRVYNRALSQQEITYLSIIQYPPEATSETLYTAANVPLTVTLSATDANGDDLTYQVTNSPTVGELTANSETSYTYLAPEGFEGTQTVVFQASDASESSSGTITIHVVVPPVAVSSELTIDQNQTTLVPFNIINPDNDQFYTKILEVPQNGTLYQTPDGSTLGSVISRNNTVLEGTGDEVIFIPGVEESGDNYATIRYQIIPGVDPLASIPTEDKSTEPDFPTGRGTLEEPYQIANLPQLISFQLSGNKSKHYELTANIDASAYSWTSIPEFSGTLDGNGFSIYNLTISDGSFITNLEGTSSEEIAVIRNLGLIDVDVTSESGAAPLVLSMRGNSEISNCFVTGNVKGQNSPTSGLVGLSYAESGQELPILKNSWSSANVVNISALENNGGIAGEWEFGVISNCYFGGSVDASSPNTGGLVGTSAAGTIINCYSFGAVLGSGGGLIGAGGANSSNSFWDTQSSGKSSSAAGTGLTKDELQSLVTLSDAGWDVESDSDGDGIFWTIDEDLNCGYPFLSYQTAHHVCAEASVTIHVVVVNDPPAFTSTPPATATEEQEFIYNLFAEDPEGDNFAFSGVELPEWLSVVSVEGGNELSGTPQNEHIGTHTITLAVTDSAGNSSEQVFDLLVIDINDLPTTSDRSSTVDEDELEIVTLPGSDPDNDALTWIITELPEKGSLYQVLDGELVGDRISQANTLLLDPNGKVYFVSGSNENGNDYTSFKFQVMDGVALPETNDTASTTATKPSGDGSATNPYQISILGHLSWLVQNPDQWEGYFLQTADIDASPTKYWDDSDDNGDGDKYNDPSDITAEGLNEGFPPIGSQYTAIFSGEYDGRGNSILELTINRRDRANIGFFGKVENAKITGVGIENANITGNANVGALVGNLHDSVVENSFSTGSVTGAQTGAYSENIGGLIGQMVGIAEDAAVSYSWSGADVVNPVSNGGGLVGLAGSNTYISHSFANGSLSGEGSFNGGLVGDFSGVLMNQTYSLTEVTANGDDTGGLVGTVTGTVENSFWDTEKSGLPDSAAGTRLTSTDLQTLGTYNGWTFTDPEDGSAYWILNSIANDGFPYLNWQKVVSLSNESTITIDVSPVSDPPSLSVPSTFTLAEDTTDSFTISSTDPEDDPVSFDIYTEDEEISIEVSGSGTSRTIEVTPEPNWYGTTDIYIIVEDEGGGYDESSVLVSVSPVNDLPVPTSFTATTEEDVPFAITLQGTDQESEPIIYFIKELPENGMLFQTSDGSTFGEPIDSPGTEVMNPNGIVLFSPDPDEYGEGYADFTVEATDPNFEYDPNVSSSSNDELSIVHQPVLGNPYGAAYHDGVAFITDHTLNQIIGISIEDGSTEVIIDGGPLDASINQAVTGPNGELYVFYQGTNSNIHKFTAPYDQNNPTFIGQRLGNAVEDAVVDQAGAYLYMVDSTNVIYRISTDGSDQTSLPWTQVTGAAFRSITMDSNGNLFASVLFGQIYKIPVIGSIPGVPENFISTHVYGMVMDASDNLWVTTHSEGDILKISPEAEVTSFTPEGLGSPHYIDVSDDGSIVVIADWDLGRGLVLTGDGDQSPLASAVVTINVTPVSDPPELEEIGTHTTNEDTPLDIQLNAFDGDGDPLTLGAIPSANISVSIVEATLTLTPAAHWHGTESITVTIDDGQGNDASETFDITVTPVDDIPVINVPTNVSGDEDTVIAIPNISAEEYDGETVAVSLAVDNGFITAVIDVGSTILEGEIGTPGFIVQGNVGSINATLSSVEYMPNKDFSGESTLIYTISDGNTTSDVAQMAIIVEEINDAPVIDPIDNQFTNEDNPINLDLGASDVDDQELTFTATSSPNITATVVGTLLTVSPTQDFNGTETVSVIVTDEDGASDSTTFNITVNPVDDAPAIAAITAVNGDEESPISLSSRGLVEPFAGDGTNGHQDGPALSAKLGFPNGMAADSQGNIYWAEYINGRIRKVDPEGNVTTFAGNGGNGHLDATGTLAGFSNPYMVAIDNSDNLYVTDSGSHVIRKISPEGAVSTLAGSPGTASNPIDGTGAQARFLTPIGIAYDSGANLLYVADYGSSAIRKIDLNISDTAPSFVTTLAGSTSGVTGDTDGNGTSATFQNPHDITVDIEGNLYVSELVGRIRKITPTGDVTTIAGDSSAGYEDGSGLSAKMRPSGISMLDENTIVFYDQSNYVRVVELANNNEVKTLFGNGSANIIHGDFSSANVTGINNIEVLNGNLYIPETATHSIHIATFGTSFEVDDADGDSLTVDLFVSNGILVIDLSGKASIQAGSNESHAISIVGNAEDINATLATLYYLGNKDFVGTDTLEYSVFDENNADGGAISITVNNVQDAPVFEDMEPISTNEEIPVNFSLSAYDADGDDLTFGISVESGNVTATIEGNQVTVTPAAEWYGTAVLVANVADGNGGTDSYDFAVEVLNVNDLPTSADSTIDAIEDVAYQLSIEDFAFDDIDGDSLVKLRFQAPTSGYLWVDLDENNTPNEAPVANGGEVASGNLDLLRYQAPSNAFGEDFATFEFEVSDGLDYSASSYTMTIHVEPVEETPTAFPVELSAKRNIPQSIILAGTDPEDTDLAFTITSLPQNGQLYQTTDGITLGNPISAIDTNVDRLVPAPGPGTLEVIPSINGSNTIDLSEGGFSNFEPGVEYTVTSTNGDMTIEIMMWGAGGGNGDYNGGADGGGGGMSSGLITLESNTPYKVIVGEGGKGNDGDNGSLGGYPGGGYGTLGDASGAGGGGYTGFFVHSIAHANSILIAGGGGGATDFGGGGNAGAGGGTNGQNSSSGSQGGSQTSGGSAISNGEDGSELQGGNGDIRGELESTSYDGGGGGGGYYGGEGGISDARAGAGGSGYVHPVLVSQGQTLTGNYYLPANSEGLPSSEFAYGARDSNQDGKPGYLSIRYVEGTTAQGANLIYVPNEDFVGEDSFSYKVTDEADLSGESNTTLATFEPQVSHSDETSELAMFSGGSASWLQVNPLPVYDDFTISFWMRTTDQGGTNDLEAPGWSNGHGLVDAGMPGLQADFGISLLDQGIAFGVGSEEDGETNVYSHTKVNFGEWFHVAATRNANTGEIQLFIDGFLEDNAEGTTEPLYAASRLVIGQLQTLENAYTGDIADLRIYNTVRTEEEILNDANMLSDLNDPSLVGYYTFEEFGEGVVGGGQEPWDLRKHYLLVSAGEESLTTEIPTELLDEDIRQVAAGPDYVLALTSEGTVHAWGDNTHGQLEIPEGAVGGVRQIAATADVAYALRSDGSVVAWGREDGNRLDTEGLSNIVKIADQGVTALFLEENGRVHIRTTGDLVISDVSEWSEGVQDIASSPLANLATIDGEAVVIGSTNHGLTSVPEEAWENVISVHAQGNTLFVKKTDGTVVAWGSDANDLTSELAELIPGTSVVRFDGGVDEDHQLVLTTGGTAISIDPTLDTFEYNQSVYFITPTPMTWHDAEAWAVTQGGHLASVDDAEEQAFLAQTFNFNSFWIGLYRVNNSWDTAEWSNGSTSTYRNWSPGEPNGPGPGGEPAAHMQHGGMWNDLSDNAGLYGIVEISDTKILQISTFLSGEGSQAGLIDSHGQLYVWGSTEGGIGEVPASMLGGVKQAEMGQDFVIALVGDNDADHLPDIFETETGEYISETDTGTSSSIADEDQDGILDGDEVALYGSNPLSTDSDEDGLSDTLELSLGLSLTSFDSDDDTFTDYHEYETGTDPLDPNEFPEDFGESAINIIADTTNDSDGDGLTDGEETNLYQTNPDVADQDQDGLNDGQEVELGTLTNNADSDEDGYEDGHEYEVGTDPLNPDEVPEGEAESDINIYADTTNDSDGDGLTDGEETNLYQTNPDVADQDQDGLNDAMEIALGTHFNNPDSDDDTFDDGHEYEVGTDPLDPNDLPEGEAESAINIYADTTNDSDGDGLTDGEETHIYFTNLDLADSDSDDLTDAQELEIGTNPTKADSDEDTFGDGHEYSTGTDPLDADEVPEGEGESPINLLADTTNDSDQDGLSDGEEINIYSSNPESSDSDSDGIEDGQEIELGLNINLADSDEDGSSDGDELTYDTNPLNPESRLHTINGTLTYSGRYDSQIYLVIDRNDELDPVLQSLEETGPFLIEHLQNHYDYRIWAFMDLNSDQEYQPDLEPFDSLLLEYTSLEANLDDQVLNLEDPNSAPTDIALSNTTLEENVSIDTVVGVLSVEDSDEGDSHQYSLLDTNNHDLFTINGSELIVAQDIDYETNPSPIITVQVADSFGETFTKSFTISITNLFTPIITTNEVQELNNSTYSISGLILHDGGAEVIQKGILYGTKPGLTLGDVDVNAVNSQNSSSIEAELTNLSPNRDYYYRTFAQNSEGVAYGRERQFKTPKADIPDLWANATSLGANWYEQDGFGVFYLQDNSWIFHQDLGWLYTSADEDGFWIWNDQLGWTWTRFDIYPYLWKDDTNAWIHYLLTNETDRVFYNASTDSLDLYPLQ